MSHIRHPGGHSVALRLSFGLFQGETSGCLRRRDATEAEPYRGLRGKMCLLCADAEQVPMLSHYVTQGGVLRCRYAGRCRRPMLTAISLSFSALQSRSERTARQGTQIRASCLDQSRRSPCILDRTSRFRHGRFRRPKLAKTD